MEPKYTVGQRVIIQPVSEDGLTKRENDVSAYAGEIGEVADFFWISPRTGQIFFIYNVRVGASEREVVVYEDELEACLA